jgi:hypothetical protein
MQVDSAAPEGERGDLEQFGYEQKMFRDSAASRLM